MLGMGNKVLFIVLLGILISSLIGVSLYSLSTTKQKKEPTLTPSTNILNTVPPTPTELPKYDLEQLESLLDSFIVAKEEKYFVALDTYLDTYSSSAYDPPAWRKALAAIGAGYTRVILANMDMENSEIGAGYWLAVGPFLSKRDAEIAQRDLIKKGWATASVRRLGLVQVEMLFSKDNAIKAELVIGASEQSHPANAFGYNFGLYDPETDSYPGVGSGVLYYIYY